MYPKLNIGGLHISMYSLMLFIGIAAFFATTIVITTKGENAVTRRTFNRTLFVSALGIAVLGVSAFVLNSLFHSIEKGKIVFGGITWLGGVLGAFPFMIFAIHKWIPKAKGNAVNFFSMLIPGMVIAHAFGRLGCFFGGCCYGAATTSPIGVIYPEGSHAAADYPAADGRSMPLIPTQLFEAGFELIVYIVLLATRKKLGKYNVEIWLIAYAIFRFTLEFWRGDDRGSTGFSLSPSQVICILMVVAATCLILFRNGVIFKKYGQKCAEWRVEAEALDDTIEETAALNPVEAIKELHGLMEAGIITEEEFTRKKEQLLNKL